MTAPAKPSHCDHCDPRWRNPADGELQECPGIAPPAAPGEAVARRVEQAKALLDGVGGQIPDVDAARIMLREALEAQPQGAGDVAGWLRARADAIGREALTGSFNHGKAEALRAAARDWLREHPAQPGAGPRGSGSCPVVGCRLTAPHNHAADTGTKQAGGGA